MDEADPQSQAGQVAAAGPQPHQDQAQAAGRAGKAVVGVHLVAPGEIPTAYPGCQQPEKKRGQDEGDDRIVDKDRQGDDGVADAGGEGAGLAFCGLSAPTDSSAAICRAILVPAGSGTPCRKRR